MSRCRCDPIEVAGCQCSFGDSDCITWSGAGTASNPAIPSPRLDEDSDNLTTCGEAGLFTDLPSLYKNPPRFKIYCSVSLPIDGPLVEQFVTFNGVEWDTAGWWDPGTDALRATCPADGTYDCRFMVAIGDTASDTLYLAEIVKNTSGAVLAYDKHEVNNVPNIGTRLQNARDILLTAGDWIGLRIEHGFNGTQYTIPDGGLGVYMSARWVAPLPT